LLLFKFSHKLRLFTLKIEQVMTQRELQDTAISALTLAQRHALDEWLNRYTARVLKVALEPNSERPASGKSSCSPAIESNISGEIEGWDGETVFKLDNGQIWEQAEYSYTYFSAYRRLKTRAKPFWSGESK
jgi:hypothetical protein